MEKDIMHILKANNQELFYSSFIAWLLQNDKRHGISNHFSNWFLDRLGIERQEINVETERKVKGGRADICITLLDSNERIVIENKTKSIGTNEQLIQYEDTKTLVVPIGLLAENFPIASRERVVTYSEILRALKRIEISASELSILVKHFINHLDFVLKPFEILDKYCKGEMERNAAFEEIGNYMDISSNINDTRFFQSIYFDRFITYLSTNNPEMIFGGKGYFNKSLGGEKPNATKWIIEKNTQGAAYLEALFYERNIPGKISMKSEWINKINDKDELTIRCRIELGKGPNDIFKDSVVGILLLGCWNESCLNVFNNSSSFRKKGSRNFHYKELYIENLKYNKLAEVLKEEMSKIWDFI